MSVGQLHTDNCCACPVDYSYRTADRCQATGISCQEVRSRHPGQIRTLAKQEAEPDLLRSEALILVPNS